MRFFFSSKLKYAEQGILLESQLKIGKMDDSKNLVTRCIFVHVVIKLDK